MTQKLGSGFSRLWTASTISNLGDGVTLAALPLLAAALTRDPGTVALVTLFNTLPWLLFSLISGALVDRLDRRLLMGRTDLLRVVVLAVLGGLVLADVESIPLLCLVAFALGIGECLFDNAALSILPMVVERESLENANSRLFATELVTNGFIGPPLGALLFAAAAAAPFFLDAVSFAIAAVLVLTLRGSFRPPARPPSTLRADIAEGVRWLKAHTLLRTCAIALGVMNLLEQAMLGIFVLYALEVLDLSKAGYGLLLGAGAIGAIAGSLAAPWLSERLGTGRMLVLMVFGFGITSLVPALWANTIAVGVASTISFSCGVAWNVVTVSLRQSLVPTELLGRVASAYRVIGLGAMPIGAGVGGLLAEGFGLRAPFFLTAAVTTVLAIAIIPWVNNRVVAEARAAAHG